MKIKQLFALSCFSLLAVSAFAQTKEAKIAEFEWEKIVPLVTKKAEVENYFGNSSVRRSDVSMHDTNYGKIYVYYGLEPKHMLYTCNPSSDTVGNFSITLTEAIPIESLGWNLDKFYKTLRKDGVYLYRYEEKGIYFTTINGQDGKELVNHISYEPSYTTMKNKCIEKRRYTK